MSAMAWLFGLGILTIGFPLLFHMIRRTPKGLTPFGSVMFLKPSPPILTRRSRLDNLLLLLLRAAAICLIVCAFMRPFFRGVDTLSEVDVANRRVAILVDTSASMRRSGLWEQVQQRVESVLGGLDAGDDVALMAFDETVRSVVAFDESTRDSGRNALTRIREQMKTLEPSWSRSDLGLALVSVADRLDIWRESRRAEDENSDSKLQIIVVSDLQKGSRTEALQAFQWPANVYVKFLVVESTDFSNATVQLLDPIPDENDPSTRIRVANSAESQRDQFLVRWSGGRDSGTRDPISFYVPAGTSQVLKVPADQTIAAREFLVSGDDEEFDNAFFVVPRQRLEREVIYLGADGKDDPQGLLFYLKRALIDGPLRTISVRQSADGVMIGAPGQSGQSGDSPTLLVVAAPVEERRKPEISDYLKSGGTVLVVLLDEATTESTSAWTGAQVATHAVIEPKAANDDYRMLADIRFSSPLFQPFSNPRYNDFTQIRFWRYQPVELQEDVDVLARFDNGAPAIWRRSSPEGGTVYTLASGWHPRDSQLALSTKFVPMISGILELAANAPVLDRSLRVGEPILFPAAASESLQRVIVKPDGARVGVTSTASRFAETDQPGIYRLAMKDDSASPEQPDGSGPAIEFAVNVDRAESETLAISIEQIEMFGVKIGEQATVASELSQMRELRDRDIENRQKFWKWLIVAALVLLISETWLAGRTASRAGTRQSSSPSTPTSREPVGEMS